jgi:hypothetical protein
MSTAKAFEKFRFFDETGFQILITGLLNPNAVLSIIEDHSVKLKKTDQHVSKIDMITWNIDGMKIFCRLYMMVIVIITAWILFIQ